MFGRTASGFVASPLAALFDDRARSVRRRNAPPKHRADPPLYFRVSAQDVRLRSAGKRPRRRLRAHFTCMTDSRSHLSACSRSWKRNFTRPPRDVIVHRDCDGRSSLFVHATRATEYSLPTPARSRCEGRTVSRVRDLCVCLWVFASVVFRALKEKRLELSTPNLGDIRYLAVARHALTLRSKGQGQEVALPAWVCRSI